VFPQPAARDRELEACAVFGRTAAVGEQERPVQLLNMNAAVLYGLGRVGDLQQQLARGLLGIRVGSVGAKLHAFRESIMCAF
jgi:hypothetical protein